MLRLDLFKLCNHLLMKFQFCTILIKFQRNKWYPNFLLFFSHPDSSSKVSTVKKFIGVLPELFCAPTIMIIFCPH